MNNIQRAIAIVLKEQKLHTLASFKLSPTQKMKNHQSILLVLLIISPLILSPIGVEGGKKKIHITDDLDDVVDNEEDEEWKEWGKSKSNDDFDPPPSDLENMDFAQIQEEFAKRHTGPAFGFVKLRLGIPRDKKTVAEIAIKWSNLLRTGAFEVKFMGIDLATVMFNFEHGQKVSDLKDFILSQDEAYEVKIGNQVFRRAGDPPFEEVVEKLRKSKENEKNEHVKQEL